MGLIKSALSATSSSFGDQFKEFVECPQIDNDVIIQRGLVKHGSGNENYSEGIISNGSTIAVPQGMAMMIIDNGKIVEFTAEAGTYTWDSSSESSVFTGGLGKGLLNTFKTIGSRFTYGGEQAKDQRVYFVNIKTIPGNLFGSSMPEIISDPVYGSVEVIYNGEYAIRVDDPIVLVNNVIGANPKETLTYDDIFKTDGKNMLKSKFAQKVSEAISTIMTMHNISFNKIQNYKSDITDKMNQILDEEWYKKYGIIVEDVALNIGPSEASREIIRKMDEEVARTTRLGEVYSNNMSGTMAAATAESMKSAASNSNGSMMGFMGMNMANVAGSNIMGAVTGMEDKENTTKENAVPEPGTIFNQVESKNGDDKSSVKNFCSNCGQKHSGGNFCTNCGHKL